MIIKPTEGKMIWRQNSGGGREQNGENGGGKCFVQG